MNGSCEISGPGIEIDPTFEVPIGLGLKTSDIQNLMLYFAKIRKHSVK